MLRRTLLAAVPAGLGLLAGTPAALRPAGAGGAVGSGPEGAAARWVEGAGRLPGPAKAAAAARRTPPPAPQPPPPPSPQQVAAAFAGAAPTQWGTHLPGVDTTVPAGPPGRHLALTFDICGGRHGSAVDTDLIALLVREQVPAALFVNARWLADHPAAARSLAAHPLLTLENHGTRHLPLSVTGRAAYGIAGTFSAAEAAQEVAANSARIAALTGVAPRWFRSGTAHYDDVAVRIVHALGLRVAGFAVNGDGGARFTAQQVQAALLGAPSGSIVILHANQARGGTREGLAAALGPLRAAGTQFVAL